VQAKEATHMSRLSKTAIPQQQAKRLSAMGVRVLGSSNGQKTLLDPEINRSPNKQTATPQVQLGKRCRQPNRIRKDEHQIQILLFAFS
jgi:ABC-type uncharacterized transport system permease subunit